MALATLTAKVGNWDRYTCPQIWIATGYAIRDYVAMNRKDWEKIDLVVKNKVLDYDVKAVVSQDPNLAVPILQGFIKERLVEMGLVPDNIISDVMKIEVTENGAFHLKDVNELGRFSPFIRRMPVVGSSSEWS